VSRERSLSVIGHDAIIVVASGMLVAARAKPGEDRCKIEQVRDSEMFTEPCRSVFMQFGLWVVI
jgi:hypothetical protein